MEGEHNPNKVQEYAQAGVAIHILIDAVNWKPGYPPPIIVLVLGEDGNYHKQTPEIKLNTHLESEQARKLAEDKARDEAESRKLAEDKMRDEAESRKRAEDHIRELEALLAASSRDHAQ